MLSRFNRNFVHIQKILSRVFPGLLVSRRNISLYRPARPFYRVISLIPAILIGDFCYYSWHFKIISKLKYRGLSHICQFRIYFEFPDRSYRLANDPSSQIFSMKFEQFLCHNLI